MFRPRHLAAIASALGLAALVWCCGDPGGGTRGGAAAGRSGVRTARAPAPGAPLDLPAYDPQVVPERLALLVGIDEYAPDSGLKPLDGSVNDVRAVRAMLVGRFGFPAGDVLVLENEDATHERIVRAFDAWLLGRAGPETEVVFWFSGHGSTVPDANDEESDDHDETLLAWDSRSQGRRGSYDIVDDELAALLAALGRTSSRATVVTDCCHSGSVTRGAGGDPRAPKTRFAAAGEEPFDPDAIGSFWPADVPLESDEKLGEAQADYTHIAACGPDQLAYEMRDGGHGALTFYLLNALETAQPHTTYQQLADEASVRVSTSFPLQTVWYEGQLDRALFSGAFAAQPEGFAASLRSPTQLRLGTGPWSGLRAGSELEVRDALSHERVGTARVERVGVTGASASFTPDAGAELREGGALRAVETSRPAGLDPLAVFVDDEELAARLEALESCEVWREDAPGRYRIALEDGRYALRTPDGLRTWLETPAAADGDRLAAAVDALEARLRDELGYRALLLFAQIPNEIPIEASFEEPTKADREAWESEQNPWIEARLRPSAAGRARAACGEFTAVGNDASHEYRVVVLNVRNPGDEPVYVTVLSVAEDRSRNRIWPPDTKGADVALVGAGEAKRVPVVVVFDAKWGLERPMRDRYLVLATEEYPDIRFRNQGSQLRGGEPKPVEERWSAVRELALAGERTRGSGDDPQPVPLDPQKLGLHVVDLLVTGERVE